MKEIKPLNLSQCWKMVNRIKNLDNAQTAILWLNKASISIPEYDELMNTVAAIVRELYSLPGHSFY